MCVKGTSSRYDRWIQIGVKFNLQIPVPTVDAVESNSGVFFTGEVSEVPKQVGECPVSQINFGPCPRAGCCLQLIN